MHYAIYANMQNMKYVNVQYAKYGNIQYEKYANMQYAKFARRSGSCRWEGNMLLALFAMKTIVGQANI